MGSLSANFAPAGRRTLGRLVAASVVCAAVAIINLLQACSFKPGRALETPQDVYAILDKSPYVTPTESDREVVIDDQKMHVEQGWTCAQAGQAASSEYVGLRVIDNLELKPNFTGTVFMNGWHLEYKNSDHHVIGIGSTIFNIVQLNNQLVWNAGGLISDDNGDDPYEWCYSYTVVTWSTVASGRVPILQSRIEMQASVSDPQGHLMFVDGAGQSGAVHAIQGSFKAKGKVLPEARLLAGFGNAYDGSDDHHVLQLGFDLGTSKVKNKKLRWTSQTVLKDNDSARSERAAEIVSILRGASVNVWHPSTVVQVDGPGTQGSRSNSWTLAARAPTDCPNIGAPAYKTYEYEIDNVPYTWAIPMLTAWDVGSVCDDNHVKHIGAWIDSWAYVRSPGQSTGTLHYVIRTDFGDDDDFPGMQDRVKVEVLGIKAVSSVLVNPGGLIPGGAIGVASANDAPF